MITNVVYKKIENLIGKRNSIVLYANSEVFNPITGDKTDSFGPGITISGIFLRREALQKKFEEGTLEEGDAYILVNHVIDINRNDKVKVDNKYYIVEDVIMRYWGDNELFKSCRLTFLGDA